MTRVRRVTIMLLAVAVLAASGARAAATTNYTDQWWTPAESGWGASVLQQWDTLFVDLFVYDADGKPTWFTAAASQQPATAEGRAIFTGDLYATRGPHYGGAFDPAAVARRKVGTLTFDSGEFATATLTYTVDGTTVVKSVTRQLWGMQNLAGSYHGGESGERTACGAEDGHAESGGSIDITHDADQSIILKLTDLQNRTRTITGTYTQHGHLGQVVGTINDPARGWTGTARLFEIESTASGITGRGHFVLQQAGADVCVWDGRWGGVRRVPEPATYRGKVLDGRIEGALVCSDTNRNGRCDPGEAQTRSDAAGGWQLAAPADAKAPLVAEVVAGVARDSSQPGTTVDASFRMASPSGAYSTNVTPFTTLVHLTARTNLPLAEALVRNELGLPPKFDLLPGAPPAVGSLTWAVQNSVVTALKATAATLDLSAPGALATVVAAFPPALTTLPTLRIATRYGAPIVSKKVYIDATFALTNPMVSNEPVILNGQIRGRGHSTWGQPKNPYHVKLAEDAGYAALADVLGLKKGRHWALLADWFDRSLIRNKLAYSLGSSSVFADGLKWTPSGQHLEVFLNDDYVGVYLLTETIRIDPNRLDIRVMNKDPAAKDVTGGYIVEVDQRIIEGDWDPEGVSYDVCYKQGDIDLQHRTPHGVPFCVDKPDEEDVTVPQLVYIKDFLDDVEADIYARTDLAKINPASFADWYLVSEFFRNPDAAFYSSDFMWKDSDAAAVAQDRLLNMGPIWDFDRGAGNVNYDNNWLTEGCWVSKNRYGNWFAVAFDVPEFVNLTRTRWQAKRAALADFVNASIDTYVRRLEGAWQRNFKRWPILGTQLVNYYTFQTYADEVAFVKAFLNERTTWLDKAYASPESFNQLCK